MNVLTLYANPRTFEEWSKGIRFLATLRAEMRWRIGDYLILGEDRFSERIWQVADQLGFTEGDLRNMMVISRKFPPDERSYDLPWSWFAAMSPLPKAERQKVISKALAGKITRAEIRALASGNGKAHEPVVKAENNSLVDAILLLGRLLVRESKGDDVRELLRGALDDVIAFATAKRRDLFAVNNQSVDGKHD